RFPHFHSGSDSCRGTPSSPDERYRSCPPPSPFYRRPAPCIPCRSDCLRLYQTGSFPTRRLLDSISLFRPVPSFLKLILLFHSEKPDKECHPLTPYIYR